MVWTILYGKKACIEIKYELPQTPKPKPYQTVLQSVIVIVLFIWKCFRFYALVTKPYAMEQIHFLESDCQLGHEFANFPKMWEPPESSRHNKVGMRQIMHWRLTNIKDRSINLIAWATWRPGLVHPWFRQAIFRLVFGPSFQERVHKNAPVNALYSHILKTYFFRICFNIIP